MSFTASAKAFTWSGVVPQQPPTRDAPASISFFPVRANSSGVIRYTVSIPSNSGRPAFGFAISGTVAYSAIFSTIGTIPSGPVEQFTPNASTPSDCNTLIATSGGVP